MRLSLLIVLLIIDCMIRMALIDVVLILAVECCCIVGVGYVACPLFSRNLDLEHAP